MKEENFKGKKEKALPEKFFPAMIREYFGFHKERFTDGSGFGLAPDWSDGRRGMELKHLKQTIRWLRELEETKGIDWTEDHARSTYRKFLELAYQHPVTRKTFLCATMNSLKIDIMTITYNPHLARFVRENWYKINPGHFVDAEKDRIGSENFIRFLKEQYLLKNIPFEEKSVMSSAISILKFVSQDDFWKEKTLSVVASGLQTIYQKIS